VALSRLSITQTVVPSARKRLRPGIGALFARRSGVTLPDRYGAALPDGIRHHWNRLSPYDQRHLLAVADDLRRSGAPDTVVLAGVLHDIGKGAGTSVMSRAVIVLLKRFAPSLATRLRASSSPPPGLKRLHLLMNHADIGARLLESHGVRQEIVWLVRNHEATSSHPYLVALKQADSRH